MLTLLKRRRSALSQLRSALGDAALVGIYTARTGLTTSSNLVSQWGDARGAGFGPSLTAASTARPTYSPTTGRVVFDGVANAMTAVNGTLANITGDCGLAVVCVFPVVTATEQRLCEIGDAVGGGTRVLYAAETATTDMLLGGVATGGAQSGATTSTYPGLRVVHARRTATNGTTVTAGLQVGAVAEVPQPGLAATPQTAAQMVLGASRAASGQFSACSVAALIVYAGNYAGKQAAVNAFASSFGATV